MKSNIVSIKPSAHLVPKDNLMITQLRGSIGPMTLTVKDAAKMLMFMAGKTDTDPYTKEIPFKKILDYVAACKRDSLPGSRLGIPRNGLKNPIGKDFNMEAIMETFEKTLLLAKDNGATIIDNAD